MQTLINVEQIVKIILCPKVWNDHYYWKSGVKFPMLNKLFPEGFYYSNGSSEFYNFNHLTKEEIENGKTADNDYYQYVFQSKYYVEDNKVCCKPYIKIYFSNNNIEGKEFENMGLLNEYVNNIKELNKNIIVL